MVILVDTNIIVDAVAQRHPFAEYANKIIEKCARREVTGFLAAHSISNLDEKKIFSALDNYEFTDFEDCLQEESAVGKTDVNNLR